MRRSPRPHLLPGIPQRSLLPARGGFVVACPRLHPACAFRGLFLLPERRTGLEVVHDEFAGIEGVAAMPARDDHEHDPVGRHELADAMDHRAIDHVPARPGFLDDLGDRALGHSGIVLERHRTHGCVFVDIAHKPHERRDCADLCVSAGDRLDLGAAIEVFALDEDLHRYPPVTGGKKATSSPALSSASGAAMSWLIAKRSSFFSDSAVCHAPPRAARCERSAAIVLFSPGRSMSTDATPTCSRSAAKKRTFTFTSRA